MERVFFFTACQIHAFISRLPSVPSPSPMASVRWSNLPPEILAIISKTLNTDVDILRLRSVCSSWRSSVPPRLRPSSFPLKVPPLFSHSSSPVLPSGGLYSLNYTTIYRISPPKHGPHAGDPSDGWLIRVSEVNPNRFLCLPPLPSRTSKFLPGTIPKYLNALDHRITEVCKCYSLNYIDCKGSGTGGRLDYLVRKVVVLCNHAVDCDFSVIVLYQDRILSYWKFGDKAWTLIDTEDFDITDVVVYKGKCYAIGRKGVLFSFDSELNLTVVPFPLLPVIHLKSENYIVEFKSDLYAVSKFCKNTSPEVGAIEISLQLKIFKKCNNSWKHIRCLGNEMLLLSDNVSVSLSAEDFRGRGANSVYVAHTDYIGSYFHGEGLHYGVFHLDRDTTSALKLVQNGTFYWPPPAWLKKIAQDS